MLFRSGTITNADNTEALETLNYLKDAFAVKVQSIQVVGFNKEVHFVIEEATYTDMIASTTALLSQFDTRLPDWFVDYADFAAVVT